MAHSPTPLHFPFITNAHSVSFPLPARAGKGSIGLFFDSQRARSWPFRALDSPPLILIKCFSTLLPFLVWCEGAYLATLTHCDGFFLDGFSFWQYQTFSLALNSSLIHSGYCYF